MTLTPVEGSAAYFETRDKIAAARERQLAAALAENERLRAALKDIDAQSIATTEPDYVAIPAKLLSDAVIHEQDASK